MIEDSVFDAALDACMAYMHAREAHLFDPPTQWIRPINFA